MATPIDLSAVESNSKKYEMISVRADPLFEQFRASLDFVKEFIIENNLIVYGGTAIDYALRLRGDCIYPDDVLAVPDLDVYSPDNVNHAYELADRFYKRGYKEVRAIRALYVRTMRVDIADKRWAADISYVPKKIFERLPYVIYEGMRVIHPDFQRIDLHSSLSFPFDNTPKEVIFDRWRKDIARFNKLATAYPIAAPTAEQISALWQDRSREIRINDGFKKYVFHGFAAYALLYTALRDMIQKRKHDPAIMRNLIHSDVMVDDEHIVFRSLDGKIDMLHFEPVDMIVAQKLGNVRRFAPIMTIVPKRYVCENVTTNNSRFTIYSSNHRMICISPVIIGNLRLKCVGVQYLLHYFMSMAYSHDLIDGAEDNSVRELYLSFYNSTMEMIHIAETILKNELDKLDDDLLNKSLFLPNVYVYGKDNISEAYTIIKHELKFRNGLEKDKIVAPLNYYPSHGKARPTFDYDTSKFFIKDGRELKD